MTFSRPLLGTNTDKVKMSWFEYIYNSCIIQGWYNCWYAFKNWSDLMGNNYQDYALLKTDDPLEQCILYFWDSLEDEIYSKEFLEHLLQLCHDIETGKEKAIPMEDVMKNLKSWCEEDCDDDDDEDDDKI
jgi:hypothetical protein